MEKITIDRVIEELVQTRLHELTTCDGSFSELNYIIKYGFTGIAQLSQPEIIDMWLTSQVSEYSDQPVKRFIIVDYKGEELFEIFEEDGEFRVVKM